MRVKLYSTRAILDSKNLPQTQLHQAVTPPLSLYLHQEHDVPRTRYPAHGLLPLRYLAAYLARKSRQDPTK